MNPSSNLRKESIEKRSLSTSNVVSQIQANYVGFQLNLFRDMREHVGGPIRHVLYPISVVH